jgi:hypothetical protein
MPIKTRRRKIKPNGKANDGNNTSIKAAKQLRL